MTPPRQPWIERMLYAPLDRLFTVIADRQVLKRAAHDLPGAIDEAYNNAREFMAGPLLRNQMALRLVQFGDAVSKNNPSLATEAFCRAMTIARQETQVFDLARNGLIKSAQIAAAKDLEGTGAKLEKYLHASHPGSESETLFSELCIQLAERQGHKSLGAGIRACRNLTRDDAHRDRSWYEPVLWRMLGFANELLPDNRETGLLTLATVADRARPGGQLERGSWAILTTTLFTSDRLQQEEDIALCLQIIGTLRKQPLKANIIHIAQTTSVQNRLDVIRLEKKADPRIKRWIGDSPPFRGSPKPPSPG